MPPPTPSPATKGPPGPYQPPQECCARSRRRWRGSLLPASPRADPPPTGPDDAPTTSVAHRTHARTPLSRLDVRSNPRRHNAARAVVSTNAPRLIAVLAQRRTRPVFGRSLDAHDLRCHNATSVEVMRTTTTHGTQGFPQRP